MASSRFLRRLEPRADCRSGPAGSGCSSGHHQNSKEYQSLAIKEGFGDYYAAIAFNTNSTIADCEFQELSLIDWDADGTEEQDIGETTVFSCEDGVVLTGVPDVPAYDYLDWKCLAVGATNNRATEYDWLRHLWDLDTDYGLTPTTIFDLWDAADPDSWNASGSGTGGNYPAQRMSDAAFAIGGSSLRNTYDVCADLNGTNR